jgi:hypothetical protein
MAWMVATAAKAAVRGTWYFSFLARFLSLVEDTEIVVLLSESEALVEVEWGSDFERRVEEVYRVSWRVEGLA